MNVEDVIRTLVTSADLAKAIEALGKDATPADLMALLRSPAGRRQLAALRQLGLIHSQLLAGKFGPFAVHRLVETLSDDKTEMRLKGAQELLKLLGIDAARTRAKSKKAASPKAAASEDGGDHTASLLEAIGDVLHRHSPAT